MASESRVPWHTLEVSEVATRLDTDPKRGLPAAEAARRLRFYGPNALRQGKRRSYMLMLAAQFGDFMTLLLAAAAVVSGFIGEFQDAVVILAIVVLNAAVGFIQEFRAERAMTALRQLAPARAVAVRDGFAQSVCAEALTPGDVLLLEAGNVLPADLRLVDAIDLKLGEAALTGESLPVDKTAATLADASLPLGDRANMAFQGTMVLYGRGRGVVVATGATTELGRIAEMLQEGGPTRTPLQKQLAAFGRLLAGAAIAICIVIFAFGILRGEPPLAMLLTALSLAVAAIPEALPAVVTVLLALGAARMARERALIRRLPAVETLGSVTTICSDKTGTLTCNEMRATEAFFAGRRAHLAELDPAGSAAALFRAMALCNNVAVSEDGRVLGDPTEIALWRAAADVGFEKTKLERASLRLFDAPFDSERKRMTTLHADDGGFIAYVKGAPESLLPLCRASTTEDGEAPLDQRAAAVAAAQMAADGIRVLALACRRSNELPEDRSAEALERDLTLLGLVGLLDPPRPEAEAAVTACRRAGIRPIMITGDHPATARAIAVALGILDDAGAVLTGRELQSLSDDALRRRVGSIQVYARVEPAQKIRIVAALQDAGEIVAMTGDGVNDAPALARADIGVAMGKAGTDVARESASLVLLDDNFATIVGAVREGRRAYDNIRKFIRYILSCNVAEILTIFAAPFLGLPMPLLPIQILWINLVTDGAPGLAFAAEAAERDVMRRPPRPPSEGFFAQGTGVHIIWVALLMTAITLSVQALAIRAGSEHWRTMTFTVLTFVQMWQAMACRSDRDSLFRQGVASNLPMLGAVTLTFALQLVVIYAPPLNEAFHTQPLTAAELAACVAASSLVLVAVELGKWIARAQSRAGLRLAAS